METTKPTLSSKTVLMNLALAILGVLVFFNIIPGLPPAVADGTVFNEILGVVTVVGNLIAVYFRKTATAKLAG